MQGVAGSVDRGGMMPTKKPKPIKIRVTLDGATVTKSIRQLRSITTAAKQAAAAIRELRRLTWH
jgi:hypothetical protein